MVSIRSATDYSPFGVQLENRNFLRNGLAEDFRMGFQGQEEDDEVKGDGNSVNYKFRMHDPRLGRFFAVDPLANKYPHNSPFAFSENMVIHCIELEGLESVATYLVQLDENGKKKPLVRTESADYINKQLEVNIRKYVYKDASGNTTLIRYQTIVPSGNTGSSIAYNCQAEAKADYSNWLTFLNSSINEVSGTSNSMTAEQSAQGLESTLNSYASESWNNGNYLAAFSWKFKAMSSGFEGETGLYRKGIPTMVATASTILTFGTGSLYTGAAAGGVSNGGGNLIGQWAQTGDIYKVDVLSVGLSTFGGVIKNPWISTSVTSALDAAIDIKGTGVFITGQNKELSTSLMDLGCSAVGGTQNNLLQKAGINQTVLNRRSFITGGMQQYSNGKANDNLEKSQGTPKIR
jgi:RHS repeat-associated protein